MMNSNLNKRINVSYFGEWWSTSNPDNVIYGNLIVFSDGQYILETAGYFFSSDSNFFDVEQNHFNIDGIGKSNYDSSFYYFRLKYCLPNGRARSTRSFDYRKTNVSYYLQTISHIRAEVELFNRCMINVLNLDLFINDRSSQYQENREGGVFKFNHPQDLLFVESDLFRITIRNGYEYNYPNHNGFDFRFLPRFDIFYSKLVTEEETRKLSDGLNWFISLCCLSPTNILKYELSRDDVSEYLTELHYHNRLVDENYKQLRHASELLITLSDVRKNPAILKRWFNLLETCPLLTKGFISVLNNSSTYIEDQFLSLINGVLTYGEQSLHSKRLKNEKNLWLTCEHFKPCFSSFYFPSKKTADEMVARRHILVHNSKERDLTQYPKDDFRLNWFRTQLQFVTISIIMSELGFGEDMINEKLEQKAINRIAFNKDNY